MVSISCNFRSRATNPLDGKVQVPSPAAANDLQITPKPPSVTVPKRASQACGWRFPTGRPQRRQETTRATIITWIASVSTVSTRMRWFSFGFPLQPARKGRYPAKILVSPEAYPGFDGGSCALRGWGKGSGLRSQSNSLGPLPSALLHFIEKEYPFWFPRESVTTGNMFMFFRGLKQLEVCG